MELVGNSCRGLALVFGLCVWGTVAQVPATLVVRLGQNFTGSTYRIDSEAQPADADGAVGLNHFVEFINGRYSVYGKSNGKRVQTMTDLAFWTQSGVSFAANLGVTDPRIVFDLSSSRWFASMVDFNTISFRQRGNRFLLAVSESSDPTGRWHGFAFAADSVTGYFADFPTMGVDANGVYLSGDLYDRAENSVGPILASLPKNELLANPPGITGLKSFGVLSYNSRGILLQPAVTMGAASTEEEVLAIGNLSYDTVPHRTLIATTIKNAKVPRGATLSAPTVYTAPPYVIADNPAQPDGSTGLDGGDTRFSASVRRVGDVLYAVHSVKLNNRAAVRWYRINAATKTLLQSGTIADDTLDLFYPSIAANDSGTAVVACNGCSSQVFVSGYAVVGETVNDLLSFGQLILLKAGTASYRNPDLSGLSRWGDYSAASVDPVDLNRFWTIQMFPTARTTWATQITEVITSPLRLVITVSGDDLTVSWPAAAKGYQLQFSPILPATGSWMPVNQTPVIIGNEASVSLPLVGSQGYFRLAQP